MSAGSVRHAAFLRGINLGKRRVKMAELRGHVETMGLEGVETFIASGNVVFDHPPGDLGRVEKEIENHLGDALGFRAETFVRPLGELERLTKLDAVEEAAEEGFHVHVIFVRSPLGEERAAALAALEGPDDRFHVLGREALWLRRGGMADSPITPRDLETALGARENTMRNLNTVRRMVAKFGE